MATITAADLLSLFPADDLPEHEQVAQLRLAPPVDLTRQLMLLRVINAINRSTWHFRREALIIRVMRERDLVRTETNRAAREAQATREAQVAE